MTRVTWVTVLRGTGSPRLISAPAGLLVHWPKTTDPSDPAASRAPRRQELQAELGVSRAVAEKLMRRLPLVVFENLRKVYVRRDDLVRLVERRTFQKDRETG